MRTIAIMLALLILPLPAFAQSTFKCGGGIVKLGDTKTDVLAKCGPPALTHKEGLERSSLRATPDKQGRQVVRTMEKWIYNFGKTRGVRILIFEGNQLAHIKYGGHGY
jgi:hypothetical protein